MEKRIKLQDIGEKILEVGNSLKTSKPEVTFQALLIAFGIGVMLAQINFRKAIEYGKRGKKVSKSPLLSTLLPIIIKRIFK